MYLVFIYENKQPVEIVLRSGEVKEGE
jgi:hypothetical protein